MLQVDTDDVQRWTPNLVNGYTTIEVYHLLTTMMPIADHVSATLLWRKDVPLKVSVFVWRLFRNRLPSKTNLLCRGIILPEARFCFSGCGLHELDSHLFLSRDFFGQI